MEFAAGRAASVNDGETGFSHVVAVGSTACVNPVDIEAFEFGSFGNLSNEFFRSVGQRHSVAVADAFDGLSYAGSPNGSSQFVDAVVEIFVVFVVPVASVELNNAFSEMTLGALPPSITPGLTVVPLSTSARPAAASAKRIAAMLALAPLYGALPAWEALPWKVTM